MGACGTLWQSKGSLQSGLKLGLILCISPLFAACTNNFNVSAIFSANTVQTTQPVSNSSNQGAFTLSRVVKDTVNPSTVLDLLGNGSGTFGNLCQSTPAAAGGQATNLCNCTLSYTSGNATQQIDTPVTYAETDFLQCSYSSLPSNLTSITVSVHLTSADVYSNTVTLGLAGGTSTLDTSNPNNFIQPIRYQCRDIVFIPYLFDTTIYDPIQSDNPHLTYPLDFYATNLVSAMTKFITANASTPTLSYWNCPPILNPSLYLSLASLTTFNNNFNMNLNVYSKSALAGGGKSIYPPNGAFDRSTFYLAKQSTGVFNIPVNAYLAPGVISSQNAGDPPLGYGASPIPVGIGTGIETCPDSSIPIPPGFQWVKVWLFRSPLVERKFPTAPVLQQQVVDVRCNPGTWNDGNGHQVSIYPGCLTPTTSLAMGNLNLTHFLADRVLGANNGNGVCVQQEDGTHGPASCVNGVGLGCNNGADTWRLEITYDSAHPTNPRVGCSASSPLDPLNVCSYGGSTIGLYPASPPPGITPYNNTGISSSSLDIDANGNANPRFDFLFVVSPPSITLANMTDNSSSVSLPYQPYRFLTASDCLSADPDNPAVGDCLPSHMINNYALLLSDVGQPANTSANDSGVFPVCALQPSGP